MSEPPARRVRGRRGGLLVVGGLVALYLAGSLLGTGSGGSGSGARSSSYSTDADGAAALADLLAGAGHRVVRLRQPLAEATLDPFATVVVLDPAPALSGDVDALRRFARAGGRVVLGGPGAAPFARALLARPPRLATPGSIQATVAAPVPEVQGVRRVDAAGEAGFASAGDGLPALAGRRGALLVVSNVGRGRLALLADASPLRNDRLARADDAALALGLAGERTRPVLFAESLHGYGPASGLSAIPARWYWALGGLALAALAFALARGRRLGPPERTARELPPPRRLYAESLGRVLARSGDRAAAVDALQAHARLRLAGAAGRGADDGALRAAGRQAGLSDDALRALLDADAGRRDPLATGQALAALLARQRAASGAGR